MVTPKSRQCMSTALRSNTCLKAKMPKMEQYNQFDSDESDSDAELQEAFAKGLLKPGLNTVTERVTRVFANKVGDMKLKLKEFKLELPWIERLDAVNEPAPLAPELAAQLKSQEDMRANLMKNNHKLPQFGPGEDPVLNDFKREMIFYRQAQQAVLDAVPKLKQLNIPIIRPSDYYAEMAKSDSHMQKVRSNIMKKQAETQRSEKIKQLRAQRKEGKAIQAQAKLQRQKEKKEMLDQVKKVRKGVSKNLDFLGDKGGKKLSKSQEKRKVRDKKFGFGGRKRGSKKNTKDSSADMSEFSQPKKKKSFQGAKVKQGGKSKIAGKLGGKSKGAAKNRPGRSRRHNMKSKAKSKGKK